MCIEPLYAAAGSIYDWIRHLRFQLSSKDGATLEAFNERSGDWSLGARATSGEWIWFHGASMGEVNSLLPIAHAIKAEGTPVIFSAVTRTGVEKAISAGFEAHYFPVDRTVYWATLLGTFSKTKKPKAIIFGETELWPLFLRSMQLAQIPLALVNARLSSTSVKRYSLIKSTIQKILSLIDVIACGSSLSAERFKFLGADPTKVVVTGNAKYDVPQKSIDVAVVKAKFFTKNLPLITLGSIRPGEEAFWYEAISRLKERSLLWAIIPRHPEKFSFFAQELEQREISFARITELSAPTSSKVLLVDKMGIVEEFYASSVLAFVGGTLCPKLGGHNLFEPTRYSVPVVAGPEGETIKDIREELVKEHGMIIVNSVDEIVATVDKALNGQLADIGKKGSQVYARHTGATNRILDELKRRKIL